MRSTQKQIAINQFGRYVCDKKLLQMRLINNTNPKIKNKSKISIPLPPNKPPQSFPF